MNTPKKEKTYFEKYDLYSDANPNDTIRIKYDTMTTLKKTIRKLERLYKNDKIKHNRNSQIVNVMTQRLRVIVNNTGKAKDRFNLSNRYFEFLKQRTKLKGLARKKLSFNINNDKN
jgi:hypothetical protein